MNVYGNSMKPRKKSFLVKKTIVDKNGHTRTVYVKNNPHAAVHNLEKKKKKKGKKKKKKKSKKTVHQKLNESIQKAYDILSI